jgi:hypothetical protein
MLSMDAANYLLSHGIVQGFGKDLTVGSTTKIPTGDGPIVSLHETGGTAPVERQNRVGNPYRRPSTQILVRARQASVARAKIAAVYQAFVGIRNQVIGDNFYLWIRPVQEPSDMGMPDDQERAQYVFNITAMSGPNS